MSILPQDSTYIRKVAIADVAALQKIAKTTFSETFSEANSQENMEQYLENGFSIEKLTSEINNSHSEFYFAINNHEVIGYLKINFGKSQTELKDEYAMEIERIYVVGKYHGKKIGQLLYEKAIEIARDKKVNYVWLGVWEENPRAIHFYKKNGFTEFDKHIFQLGDDQQTDILMKKIL